jgi:hypothetical protein
MNISMAILLYLHLWNASLMINAIMCPAVLSRQTDWALPGHVLWLESIRAIDRALALVALTELLEGNWSRRSTILRRWLWPGTDASTDLESGKFPRLPTFSTALTDPYVLRLWR